MKNRKIPAIPVPEPGSKYSLLTEQNLEMGYEVTLAIAQGVKSQFSLEKIGQHNSSSIDTTRVPDLDIRKTFAAAITFQLTDSVHYQIRILIEFDENQPKIHDHAKAGNLRAFDRSELSTNLEKMASKYAIWIEYDNEETPTFKNPIRLICFDSWPHFSNVERFPHHYHLYDSNNERSKNGYPFSGQIYLVVPFISKNILKKSA